MFEKQAHLQASNDDRRASNWALPHTDGSVTTEALLQGVDPRQACHRDGPRSDLRRLPETSYRRGGAMKIADRTRTTIFSHRDVNESRTRGLALSQRPIQISGTLEINFQRNAPVPYSLPNPRRSARVVSSPCRIIPWLELMLREVLV